MSTTPSFRQARLALATVIEELPYGDPLSQQCAALISQLRDHEYAHSDPTLAHQDRSACGFASLTPEGVL
jgi:demethoxyubiquinone hydroxylase (CLK1/Coq7/Cat5 family)